MTSDAIDVDDVADAVGDRLGIPLRGGSANLTPVPTPGLPDDSVWRVADEVSDHPIEVYVGRTSDGAIVVLSDDHGAWRELVDDLGAHLSSPSEALGYVRVFLEATRDPTLFVQEVTDVDQIPWRPGTPDEEARRDRLLETDVLAPPTVSPVDGGFDVTLTLLVDDRVQRNHFEVSNDGALSTSYETLAEGLPLPVVR